MRDTFDAGVQWITAADPRVAIALVAATVSLVGVAASLFWNWANWRRGTRLNQAAQFETVHGDALKNVIATLAAAAKQARDLTQELDDVVDAPKRISKALRHTITEASHQFSTEIERVAASKLSRNRDGWIELAQSERWDEVWSGYTKARGNENLLGVKKELMTVSSEIDRLSSAITDLRVAENDTR